MTLLLRRTSAALRRPLLRLLDRTVSPGDPWRRFPCDVPLARFGMGARRDFPWYFEGESAVRADSVEAIAAWLLGCAYARDRELFGEADVWQHPRAFEQRRRGDCEDFALWAWRKLVELGYEAELVAGYGLPEAPAPGGHAWVLYHDRGTPYLLDAVVREPWQMVRPLADVRHRYVPEVAVDARFRRYVYGGYLQRRRASFVNPPRPEPPCASASS